MAYAALISLEQTLAHFLNHEIYSLSPLQNQKIISTTKNFTFLRAFLEDFPEKSNNILERRMRDLANQLEFIIECFMWRRNRYRHREWVAKLVFKSGLYRVAAQVDSIAAELLEITKEAGLRGGGGDDNDAVSPALGSSSIIAPSHRKDAIIGFDDDLMAIKERLCGQSPHRQIISIVGMGGIGKTTLARYAYYDPLIIERFEIQAWVAVSQDYRLEKIISDLLTYMKEFDTERVGQRPQRNEEKVYKCLKGRRYLIVMDDMWSTKAWDDIRMLFPDDNNGSRVILTTRLSDVASYVDSSGHLHGMHLMGTEQSWDLLRHKVFSHEPCPLELIDIGKEIARCCKGLPLAIVVTAGLLSVVSKTAASWEETAKDVKLAIATEQDGQFEKILSLSYTYLPHHLRPYFLYMGAFPEDYEIKLSKLVKLWVAEGFVKPCKSKTLEEMAEENLEELVKRSLVLVSKRTSTGKIKSCTIHDLMRELCIKKAEQDKFLVRVMQRRVSKRSIKNEHRVSMNCYDLISFLGDIICFKHTGDYLGRFSFARVLNLIHYYVDISSHDHELPLPAQVFELFHLRYLAFDLVTKVPASISNLQNLQTLILHPRTSFHYLPCFVTLPLEIWRMPQLRHLISFYFGALPNPDQEGLPCVLENLQTLSIVKDFVCNESILKAIPNVRKLGIHYSRYEYKQYHLENLVHLQQLEKLKLSVNSFYFYWWNKLKLAFPVTLSKLTLSGWGLSWENMSIIGSLPNLQVLKLRNSACDGETWITTEGEFPELKFLAISESVLGNWITESSHFPRLECLMLRQCENLREIPDGIGEIPTLELIEVRDCNKNLMESAKLIQEEQQSYGNDALEVRCV